MKTYLACFDISADKARAQVVKHLLGYGVRVQKSVFEINISATDFCQLKAILREWKTTDDDIRFYALCQTCRQKSHTVEEQRVAYWPAVVIV